MKQEKPQFLLEEIRSRTRKLGFRTKATGKETGGNPGASERNFKVRKRNRGRAKLSNLS